MDYERRASLRAPPRSGHGRSTDATEVNSHKNTQDSPESLQRNSIEHLGSGYPDSISELSDCESANVSALSRAPRGLLTLTLEALGNIENMGNPDLAERLLEEGKREIKRSWMISFY